MENISTYYNTLAPDYDRLRFGSSYGQFIHHQERRALTGMLKNIPSDQVLDLACGTGRFLEFAQTGCDLSSQMLVAAQQKHPSKSLVRADASQLPFTDGAFDAVFSMHFFMHLDQATTTVVFDEVWRVLRSGGRFCFDFPSARRRRLTGGHHDQNWHGSNAMSLKDLANYTRHKWQCIDRHGIMFLPIHRLPLSLRPLLLPLDTRLCRSFLSEYASYHLVCLQKK